MDVRACRPFRFSRALTLTLVALLVSAGTPSEVLLPAHGCARGDGVPAELCARALSAHALTAVAVSELLTATECERFIAAAEAAASRGGGWRSVLRYDTREVPLHEISELHQWYEAGGGRERLLALVRAHHLPVGHGPANPANVRLELFDSNVVKYDSASADGSTGVCLHSDGEDVFTFNVLLSDADSFGPLARPPAPDASGAARAACGPAPPSGPSSSSARGRTAVGTFFAHLNRTVCAQQGQAVSYYGGLVHSSGQPLGWGMRYIWQGFLRPASSRPSRGSGTVGAVAGAAAEDDEAEAEAEASALAALEFEIGRVAAPLARAGVRAAEQQLRQEPEQPLAEGLPAAEGAAAAEAALGAQLANLCAVLGRRLGGGGGSGGDSASGSGSRAEAAAGLDGEDQREEEGRALAEALAACERAVAASPTAGAHNNLGLLLQRAGDTAGAEAALRAGLRLLDAPARGSAQGQASHASGRAPASSEDARAHAEEGAELWTNLGALLRAQPGRAAEAAAACEAAVSLAPLVSALHVNLGAALLAHADPLRARAAFERALQLEPAAGGARFNLAVLHLQRGEAEEAVPHLRALLAASPHDDEARRALARAYAEAGRFDEAIELSREGARLSTDGTAPAGGRADSGRPTRRMTSR